MANHRHGNDEVAQRTDVLTGRTTIVCGLVLRRAARCWP